MIWFIDGPFIRENKYDLVYLGTPSVNLNDPAFSDFDPKTVKDFQLLAGPMQCEDYVFVLAPSGGKATVNAKEIHLDPCDFIAIQPDTLFLMTGEGMTAKSIRPIRELNKSEYTYVGKNCRVTCSSDTLYFDNATNKNNAIGKLYDLPAITMILQTLTFQMYNPSSKLVFPDRKTARLVFSFLQQMNREYEKHYEEIVTKSQSHLISFPSPPMTEKEDLADVLKWMKTGFQKDHHTQTLGNVKLF